MQLNKNAIEHMGYKEFPDEDRLTVKFAIQRVYSLQGLSFQNEENCRISNILNFGSQCKVVISESVNDGTKKICGEDYTDNEQEWAKEKNARPPYLLVSFEESEPHTLCGGYRQEKDGKILTYDAFQGGKNEIKKWEKEELPSIITSITAHFSTDDHFVNLISLDRNVYGKTEDGKILFDLKMAMKAEMFSSLSNSVEQIDNKLKKSADLYSFLDEKSSRHIFMALNEPDRLKQFLYYFLFVERFTHNQFSKIDYDKSTKNIFIFPERVSEVGAAFFKDRHLESKNLSQRFYWCSLLIWPTITDADIKNFKELKKIRDLISHGENIEESKLPVHSIRALSIKLLGCINT